MNFDKYYNVAIFQTRIAIDKGIFVFKELKKIIFESNFMMEKTINPLAPRTTTEAIHPEIIKEDIAAYRLRIIEHLKRREELKKYEIEQLEIKVANQKKSIANMERLYIEKAEKTGVWHWFKFLGKIIKVRIFKTEHIKL